VCVVASNYPDEGRSASEHGDSWPELPFRTGGTNRPTHAEARAELRDRETYYAELRFAVRCQGGSIPSIPAPRAALDDNGKSSAQGESWDDMTARFGDTWT
jgi:hypothetical protein